MLLTSREVVHVSTTEQILPGSNTTGKVALTESAFPDEYVLRNMAFGVSEAWLGSRVP
jgi:hypothetical protein